MKFMIKTQIFTFSMFLIAFQAQYIEAKDSKLLKQAQAIEKEAKDLNEKVDDLLFKLTMESIELTTRASTVDNEMMNAVRERRITESDADKVSDILSQVSRFLKPVLEAGKLFMTEKLTEQQEQRRISLEKIEERNKTIKDMANDFKVEKTVAEQLKVR